ncbi:hypothetical protein SAMN04487830_10234 [Pseudobutyrivibrio sp. OR37]|nr:hypothetical protein SAMN04487830_10234 [Pseudobutyrivibrio sp. OR37]
MRSHVCTFIKEIGAGSSKHLLKAINRLTELNKLIRAGSLGVNDLDIAEALISDLEYAIKLFKQVGEMI